VIQQHITRCHGAHTWVVRPTLPVFLRLPVPKLPSRETVTSTLTVKLSPRVQLRHSLTDLTETNRLNPQSISRGENVCFVSGCTRKRVTAPFAQSTQTACTSCSGCAQEHQKLYGTTVRPTKCISQTPGSYANTVNVRVLGPVNSSKMLVSLQIFRKGFTH
jgi:hypothetical protein